MKDTLFNKLHDYIHEFICEYNIMSVLVIGDLILDINYIGNCNRIAPEAPIPVTKISSVNHNLGGALNIANNLISMGNTVNVIGIVGNDSSKDIILRTLGEKNINTNYILIDNMRPTTTKHRVFVTNKLVSRFDVETNKEINDDQINMIIKYTKELINTANIIIISDYLKGVLTEKLTQSIIRICRENNKDIFVDPKDINYIKYKGCTLIKPNKSEGELILGKKIDNVYESIIEIKNKLQSKYCLLTLSEHGLAMVSENNLYKYYTAIQKNVIDVTGAGDTVLASFVHYYLKTNNLQKSAEFANYCGQIKVTHNGTYAINDLDILNYEIKNKKLVDMENIGRISETLKKYNKKIIFTNGCFDILHYGHLIYLEEAKNLGDVFIVGINGDDSIKRNKGESRPYNKLEYRLKQLEMLSIVDFIVVFDDDTPIELIKLIRPDILVKGGDYKIENIIGKEYVGETMVLSYVDGISSTKLIESIE